MKVLVWKSKYGNYLFDITNDTKLDAFYHMFRIIDKEFGYYVYDDMDDEDKQLYDKALNGDRGAAMRLIHNRADYEYESFEYEDVLTKEDFAKKFGE